MTNISIVFLHSAPTPHNNYLLDSVASIPDVSLSRFYIETPSTVPGRPWKSLDVGQVQSEKVTVGINPFFSWKFLRLAIFDNRSVFFIIGWDYPLLVISLFIITIRKCPLIMFDDGPSLSSVSNINNFSIRQFIKRTLIRLINNSPGTYFVTSRHSMEDLVQMGFVKGKLAQLPFFTKPSIYSTELREKHGCSKKDCLIFAGGRLIDQKGFDLLITAMSMVSAPINYARKLVIVGSGSAETKLKHLTKSLSISDYVDFLPWAEADLFASYIYSCDIFVAPARLDHFPTTVIAAMQAGIPVVATDGVGSAVEFIESGRNGIIVPSESPEALASALEQLINDPTLREVLGSAAKVTMSEWPVERGARLVVDAARKALIQCAD